MRKYLYPLLVTVVVLSLMTSTAYGQSIKGLTKSAINHLSSLDITGTWKYTGAAVEFESDNLLKKAGGKAASATLEKKVDSQLSKLGFETGVTTFTFSSDSTFTNTTGSKTLSGKYTYDNSTKYITLKYASHIPLKAKLSGSGSKISLLFEANGFLSFATFIGSHSGISVVKSLTSVLNSYDGMMVGMELQKE